ncbi:MAG: isoprenoid biosynthesis glyoxalase ElbB [Candidatus Neomarinimicrobiota bacterium]|nr:isoprenoid biosynthesis glyoxalase ElbB [Candidatus Neomarinimicrobiota bacterium]MEC9436854.1 isoprenoid biosynthesis glyoxalase ElbB [Candidatus Neomarinimicrobiota bacterium]|tara:strand:- start:3578 stop:4237 length:660 start_codon:yes stop_codon:yes gene_type:complete
MKIGVLLSGCGVNDGSEIHETVITMLALDRADVETHLMAPNIDQMHVINHYTGQEMDEFRNVLVESARIARGDIKDMAEVTGGDLDALIIPGGFGVAKNLSDYAMSGAECSINPDVYRLVSEMVLLKKPIGAICIAPAMMAKILAEQNQSATMTIGKDESTAKDIQAMGSTHKECPVEEMVIDEENNIVTTPAYMDAKNISEAAEGIEKLVEQIILMVK